MIILGVILLVDMYCVDSKWHIREDDSDKRQGFYDMEERARPCREVAWSSLTGALVMS